MADSKISALTAKTPTGTEEVPVNDAGTNKKVLISAIVALVTKTTVGLANVANVDTTNADNISDGTSKKLMTAAERTKLAAITGTNTGDQTLNSLLPTQTGNTNKALFSDGTNAVWRLLSSIQKGLPTNTKVFFPEDYGAVGDGTTDDTTAFTNCIAAAGAVTSPVMKFQNSSGVFLGGTAATGGGVVFCTSNAYLVSNIVLKHGVQLVGMGWNTFIIRKASSTGPVITNQWDTNMHAKYCQVRDLVVFGNKSNNTNTGAAIFWTGNTTNTYNDTLDTDYDNKMYVHNVWAIWCKGNGFDQVGSSSNHYDNCHAQWCDGRGFVASQDTKYTNCDSGHSGREGFRIGDKSNSIFADNVQLTNCKAWYSGEVTATDGRGFVFNCDNARAVCCEAQDNKREGFLLDTCNGVTLTDCLSEENNRGVTGDPGITLYQAKYCRVSGTVKNRYGHTQMANGCAIGASNSNAKNIVDLTFMLQADGWGITTPYVSGYDYTNNRLYLNGVLVTS